MKRFKLLAGALVAIGVATVVTPALASEMHYLTVRGQVTVGGEPQLDRETSSLSASEYTCDTPQDQALCDVIVALTPRDVVLGNDAQNVSVTAHDEPCDCQAFDPHDEVYVHDRAELRTRSVDRLHNGPIDIGEGDTSTTCGNAIRDPLCDTIEEQTPQEVTAGNDQRGVTIRVWSERKPAAK